MLPKDQPETFVALLAGIGAAIGLGKLLASSERLTARLVVGRAVTSGGLGAAAGATSILFPSADPIVFYGAAAVLASLGTSALEALFNRNMK